MGPNHYYAYIFVLCYYKWSYTKMVPQFLSMLQLLVGWLSYV